MIARVPRVLFALALAAAGSGCASDASRTEAEAAARARKACEDLAVSFYSVAEDRDEGMTRDEQVARARQRIDRRKGDETFSHWLRVIDLVYRSPRDTPKEIAAKVLENCEVDAQGQAVVKTTWPTGGRRRR